MPEPGAARPTVMYCQLQAFYFGHTERIGAGSCWGASFGPCAGSLSTAGSIVPSKAAPAGTVFLEDDDELQVHPSRAPS